MKPFIENNKKFIDQLKKLIVMYLSHDYSVLTDNRYRIEVIFNMIINIMIYPIRKYKNDIIELENLIKNDPVLYPPFMQAPANKINPIPMVETSLSSPPSPATTPP